MFRLPSPILPPTFPSSPCLPVPLPSLQPTSPSRENRLLPSKPIPQLPSSTPTRPRPSRLETPISRLTSCPRSFGFRHLSLSESSRSSPFLSFAFPAGTTFSTPLHLDSPTFTPFLPPPPLPRYRLLKSCACQQTSPLFNRARTERPSRTLERKSTFRSGTLSVDSLLLRRRTRSRKLGIRRGSWVRREGRTR